MLAQADPSLDSLRYLFDILLLVAIIGAVVDRQYKKAGGMAPTRKHRLYFGIVAAVCVAFLVVMGATGASAEFVGRRTADLAFLLFIAWELWRWFVRRSHRVNRTTAH